MQGLVKVIFFYFVVSVLSGCASSPYKKEWTSSADNEKQKLIYDSASYALTNAERRNNNDELQDKATWYSEQKNTDVWLHYSYLLGKYVYVSSSQSTMEEIVNDLSGSVIVGMGRSGEIDLVGLNLPLEYQHFKYKGSPCVLIRQYFPGGDEGFDPVIGGSIEENSGGRTALGSIRLLAYQCDLSGDDVNEIDTVEFVKNIIINAPEGQVHMKSYLQSHSSDALTFDEK